MKILILGITGKTGSLAAEAALKRGHKVVGIARDPGKVTVKGAEIVAGTPYDAETVQKAVKGCDAVISTLSLFPNTQGIFSKVKSPLDSMSVSMKNIVKSMGENGIKRIVLMTALGAGDSSDLMPWFFGIIVKISNIRYAYADHNRQEQVLENSDLDWTIVRPVMLTDKTDDLSVAHNLKGTGKIKGSITRIAVANFMIDCIEKELFIREKPGISNGV
jgi:putative NADH-flavin reductase